MMKKKIPRYVTKKYLFCYMLAMFLLFLLKEPQIAMEGARFGLLLWAKQLLPSLLPFLILTQLLIRSGYLTRISERLHLPQSCFVLFAGTLFGFPMGCKLTTDLYARGQLSKKDASLLFVIANQMSPAFVGGYILSETLHQPQMIPVTYAILYLPSLCYGLLMLMLHHHRPSDHTQLPDVILTKKSTSGLQMNFAILDAGIMNSFETMLKLGGYVMLFAVITHMCQHFLAAFPLISTLIASLLEITGAVSVLNNAIHSAYLKYIAVLTATAFGGCSGIAQTASLIHADDLPEQLSMKSYICGRLCIAGITAILATALYPLAIGALV